MNIHTDQVADKRPISSKILIVALPLVAALAGVVLWNSARQPAKPRLPRVVTEDSPLAKVAVQAGDLPAGYVQCSLSGEITDHIAKLRASQDPANRQAADAAVRMWDQFRLQGATGAYVAYWGDSAQTCDVVEGKAPMQHSMDAADHSINISQVLVSFADTERAAAAFDADGGFMGHKQIRADENVSVRRGEETGLGPNSVFGVTNAQPPTTRMVWQTGSLASLVSITQMDTQASQTLGSAVNARMAARPA